MSNPLVSICCLTFNHAEFIQECLEGFLQQETSFEVEILIHDDASTDGTDRIVRQYAQKYPEKIFPLYETTNQYTNGYKGKMDITFNYSRARGKYIACCEGDDYWTDPLKLQKQVAFMESHKEYSVCFHRCTHLNMDTGGEKSDNCGVFFGAEQDGIDITMNMFFESWITQPLTMLFRKSKFSSDWQKQYQHYRDMHEIYHLLSVGKGYLFAFNGGVYRYHSGGIHSMISELAYCENSLPIDKEFYMLNPSKYSKQNYINTLQACIATYARYDAAKAITYLLTFFKETHDFTAFFKSLRLIIRKHNGK